VQFDFQIVFNINTALAFRTATMVVKYQQAMPMRALRPTEQINCVFVTSRVAALPPQKVAIRGSLRTEGQIDAESRLSIN
jgi:hypothetical protein